MTRYPYVSGWCGKGSASHAKCQTTYGKLRTLCTCPCHDVKRADLAGQVVLFPA